MERAPKVLIVATHPVQYASPNLRLLAKDPRVEIQVVYCSLQGAEAHVDPDFGVEVKWDVPLLEGYPWTAMKNRALRPRAGAFWGLVFGLINPEIWRMVRSREFDAVLFYTGYMCATFWIALIAAKICGVPVLFGTDATSFTPRDKKNWKVPIKRRLLPWIFRRADVVIIPSEAGRQFILGMDIETSRVVLTPFVVDNAWWEARAAEVNRREVREKWGIPEDAAVAVFCAKLQSWKRPDDALRAFAKADAKDAYLVFAGDGPMREALETEARSLGVGKRVRFLGFVNQSGLPSVYASADLLVMPSEYDPCPVVVCEAMLCGCSVVLSDEIRGRFDLVKNGETGFIYRCGNVDALAQILSKMLGDRAALGKFSEAARERMRSWSPQMNMDATIEAIGRAVARSEAELHGAKAEA